MATEELTPLAARDALVKLIRAKAPRSELVRAAEAYRDAIRRRAKATGRKLPVPSTPFLLRFLS
jgi:hypothetical protein